MIHTSKFTVFIILSLLILISFTGCGKQNDSKQIPISGNSDSGETFNLEQFQKEMTARGYHYEMQDAEKDFLKTPKKRMVYLDEVLNIYLFSNNKEMEKTAKGFDRDGGGYSNGSEGISFDWIIPPHYFKKGILIVKYAGDNERILSDLKDIFGEQFAGYQPHK
jgi:hypothetical protein